MTEEYEERRPPPPPNHTRGESCARLIHTSAHAITTVTYQYGDQPGEVLNQRLWEIHRKRDNNIAAAVRII